MNSNTRPSESSANKMVDHIAKGLPDDVRADFYRIMRRCRDLPENDEMLCILDALKILTLLTVTVPDRMVTERENLEKLFTGAARSQAQLLQSNASYQTYLDARISDLPETILKGVNPAALTAKINQSLEQHFIQSELPQMARALKTVATDMSTTTAQFKLTADTLGNEYRKAATNAKQSIEEMELAIANNVEAARRAANKLIDTF